MFCAECVPALGLLRFGTWGKGCPGIALLCVMRRGEACDTQYVWYGRDAVMA